MDSRKKEIKNIVTFTIGSLILLLLIFVAIPPSQGAMGVYLFGLIIALVVYNNKTLQNDLFGISFKGNKLIKSIVYGIIFGAVFLLATALVPGLSLGLPLLPNAISDNIRLFVIIFVAPIIETIIFQGAIFGYFRSITKPKTAITIQALIFALAHIASYVTGFYAYPDFTTGLSAILANISSFFAAFLFAWLAGWFVAKDGIRNLLFVMIFHMILNSVIYVQAFSIILGG